jgi:nitrite reductase/ring-hydroxylating ferredoxin subunit/uncharacterized membrane protein
MIGRLLSAIVEFQTPWARPLGEWLQRLLRAIFAPIKPVKDFLNGKWLGHSLHAAMTDLPIGALTLSLVFDVAAQPLAADVSLGFAVLAMIAAAITGLADYTDTDDRARTVATFHALLNIGALLLFAASLVIRLAGPDADRIAAFALLTIGYAAVAYSAWVGGEVVYALGNMVNRHAWRFGGSAKWLRLDIVDVPEGRPIRARAGQQSILLYRQGQAIHALHDVCAHAGGPLSEGRVVDGCIECPWHASRYELASGRRRSGPTTFDQPRYEIRPAEGGGWEVRRCAPDTGAGS